MTKRSLPNSIACVAISLGLWFASVPVFAAQDKPGTAAQPAPSQKNPLREKSSLDDELLKDLGGDPLAGEERTTESPGAKPAGLRDAKEGRDAKNKRNSPDSDADALDRELLKGLDDGEDLGADGEQNPLARLNQEMRRLEALIAQQNSGDDTRQLQTQVVRDLEELIRQARKKSKQGNSSSGKGGTGKGGQQASKRRDASQPGKQSKQNQSSDTAARQSSKRTHDQAAQKPDMADMRELLKGVWGQLPERQREQMLQSYEEQFLPKYEQMISDYFRSIAEEGERKR